MIQVEVFKTADRVTGFSVKGHAGQARRGKDIVCAAVSTLVINTVNSIEKFTDDEFIEDADDKAGIIEVHFPQELSSEAGILVKSMISGLEDIRDSAGYIEISYEEE